MAEGLKKKSFLGVCWGFFEKFSTQLVTLVVGVILARLLSPSDYGLIAITEIFVVICQIIVDSGFSSALIRKSDRTENDYSTVFIINIGLSFLMAIILCVSSSFIADFYNEPLLKSIICFNAVYVFLGALISIQAVKMQAEMKFKERSEITVISSIIKGAISVFMALIGYGVWSLVIPNIIVLFVTALLYWHFQHWIPSLRFSLVSAKEMFAFGSKLLISTIINTIYTNLYPMIIGKKFSPSDLGFYSKGNAYANLPSTTIANVIGGVAFPVLSKIQDDDERLRSAYRKMLRLSAYLVFPIMIGLVVLAKPFVILLITEKWSSSILYLQILCLAAMWYPIHGLNLNLLQVKGRSDLFLRLEIIKKIIGVIIIIVMIPHGLICICIGSVISSVLGLFINTYYTGKLINVGFIGQLRDLSPAICYSTSMGIVVWGISSCFESLFFKLIFGSVLGILYYIVISVLTKSSDFFYFRDLVFNTKKG